MPTSRITDRYSSLEIDTFALYIVVGRAIIDYDCTTKEMHW